MTGMVFSHSWSGGYAKRTYTMELSIGDAVTTPATISDTYTLNFAGTLTMVFSGVLNWPQRSRGPNGSRSTPARRRSLPSPTACTSSCSTTG